MTTVTLAERFVSAGAREPSFEKAKRIMERLSKEDKEALLKELLSRRESLLDEVEQGELASSGKDEESEKRYSFLTKLIGLIGQKISAWRS